MFGVMLDNLRKNTDCPVSKPLNSERTDLRPSGVMQPISSHGAMVQFTSLHTVTAFATCPDIPQHYKFNTCTVTQRLCYDIFTYVLLASIHRY
jgi:hypothetical protein